MAGLDPAIHVFVTKNRKQDVDHRDEPGDDAECVVDDPPMHAADTPHARASPQKALAPSTEPIKYPVDALIIWETRHDKPCNLFPLWFREHHRDGRRQGQCDVFRDAECAARGVRPGRTGQDGCGPESRGKHFSGAFDLNVFANGNAEDQYLMVKAGAELALRILSFPTPVVVACQGNAFPMGAFLIMSADHRIAAEGNYRIGMNEVAIGLTVPRFAIEIARQRLTPAYFSRVVMTSEMFAPAEAATAGFFDRVVPADQLDPTADAAARALSTLNI